MDTKELLKARRDELHAEIDSIQAEWAPIDNALRSLQTQVDGLKAEMREEAAKKDAKKPRYIELSQELSAVAKALGGLRMNS